MADWSVLLAFFSAALVIGYMPGPAMVYATAQALARGRRAWFMAALGLHLGCYVHVAAAALGLSALFVAVPWLYMVVKLLGAGYLTYLGARLILRSEPQTHELSVILPPQRSARAAFLQSMIVEILNPKTALFFLAFLPQFVDQSGSLPIWAQLLILGTAVNVIFSSADVVCVTFVGVLSERLRRSGAGRRFGRVVCGSALMGLGASLALTKS
ncbi:MAG: LysE family translocator [Pseudomonadota bacterium]